MKKIKNIYYYYFKIPKLMRAQKYLKALAILDKMPASDNAYSNKKQEILDLLKKLDQGGYSTPIPPTSVIQGTSENNEKIPEEVGIPGPSSSAAPNTPKFSEVVINAGM